MSAAEGAAEELRDFHSWFTDYTGRESSWTRKIPFVELRGWRFEKHTGNLVHETGRFFSVQGMRIRTDRGPVHRWSQPVINQPETGILGILVKEFNGVLHCLMQAKMEPGNHNGVQLSPTVQATRSNYTRVHGGRPVPYLEYFRNPRSYRVVTDVLQSEQGSWFYRKRNRNMVVEVTGDVPVLEGYRWVSIGRLHALLAVDDLVNMDTRTVMSCLPLSGAGPAASGLSSDGPAGNASFRASLAESLGGGRALHTDAHVRSWITDARVGFGMDTALVGLADVEGWHRSPDRISHETGRFFDVVAVDVRTGSREVGGWTQPMVEARGRGVVAFLVQRIDGVLHVLVNVKAEPGFADVVELAPTVQCTPENYADLPAEARPPFLDEVLHAPADGIRFDATLSEEGGRFFHTRARYLVVEVPPERDLAVPDDFRWLTAGQLSELNQHSHYVNVQARSLMACLHSLLCPSGWD